MTRCELCRTLLREMGSARLRLKQISVLLSPGRAKVMVEDLRKQIFAAEVAALDADPDQADCDGKHEQQHGQARAAKA